jgi:hypothetical protein
MSENYIYRVEGQHIVCSLQPEKELPKLRYTEKEVELFTALHIVQGRRGGFYLAARKQPIHREIFTAPSGAILKFFYSTGTSGHRYHEYRQYFIVEPCGQLTHTLKDTVGREGHEDIPCRLMNIRPIQDLDEMTRATLEAEIKNKGWLPSFYDPVLLLYHIWLKGKKAAVEPQPSTSKAAAEEGEDVRIRNIVDFLSG